ncbi:hypothetical protein D3C78_1496090 [compost metagenome]
MDIETLSQNEVGEKRFRANRQPNAIRRSRRMGARMTGCCAGTSSLIRTMTVGSGISPDLLTPMSVKDAGRSRARHIAWHTAGGELHPALKTYCMSC